MSKKTYQPPDMYFESTKNFKKRPCDVKKKDHFCSDWTTSSLYCIESGESGTYLVYDLHKRPHYQYNVQDRSRIKKEAEANGIRYRFSKKPKFVDAGNLYHYTNESQKYKDIMNPLVNKFDLDNQKSCE